MGTVQEASAVLNEMGVTFDYPKPVRLISYLIQSVCSDPDALVLDSFAGSGTTGHSVLELNRTLGGQRRFIAIELSESVARDVTAPRLTAAVKGWDSQRALGSGFRFCTLGEPLFDADGNVNPSVTFVDLAAHVFFCETGSPIPRRADGGTSLLGAFQGRAIYLLHASQSMGVPSVNAGNVLTASVLEALPVPSADFNGQRVVYAEGCTVPDDRLATHGVTFKQVPYQIEGL